MSTGLLVIIALLLSVGSAQAQTVQRVEIYEFGTYASSAARPFSWTRQGLQQAYVNRIERREATQTIVARIGVEFGFRYRIVGNPRGVRVPVKIVARYPSPGVLAPNRPVPFVLDEENWIAAADDKNFYLWTFEKRADLVPGVWTFEIWIGGAKMAEQKFTVILPPVS